MCQISHIPLTLSFLFDCQIKLIQIGVLLVSFEAPSVLVQASDEDDCISTYLSLLKNKRRKV